MILLARGLDQHDDEGPGSVGKPDRADALADAPVHDGHPRIFSVKRDACIEIDVRLVIEFTRELMAAHLE